MRKPELSRFLKRAQRAASLTGEVNLLLADDLRIKDLNKNFRGKNKATDVLSFPAAENAEGLAGDLAISVETAARQAAEHGHPLEEELRILMLHGLLHLAGHDHEVDSGEMRTIEAELRVRLQLPTGLIERVLSPKGRGGKASRSKASAVGTSTGKTAADKASRGKRPSGMEKTAAKKSSAGRTRVAVRTESPARARRGKTAARKPGKVQATSATRTVADGSDAKTPKPGLRGKNSVSTSGAGKRDAKPPSRMKRGTATGAVANRTPKASR